MSSREETTKRIARVIAEVTLVEEDKINEDSHLFDDLGVESIDFVDIIYNLESEFGIEIPNDALFSDRNFLDEDTGHMADGVLTKEGRAALAAYPYLNQRRLAGENPGAYLYSVANLVDFVENALKSSD